MGKNYKKEQGITLVALVVTIIVLLILAAVSLSAVFSQDGIFSRAENAATEHRAGTVDDEVSIWKNEKLMAKYEGSAVASRDELIESQKSRGLLTEEEAQTAKTTGKVEIGTKTIEYGTDAKSLVEAFKAGEIKVGDYVTNYNSTLYNSNATANLTTEETGFDGGTQTYKVDPTTTWRVVGLNVAGTELMLTTGSPIKKQMDTSATEDWKKDPYLYLDKAEGWYNTNDELVPNNNILDKVCSIYNGRYASSTKSMRIEDINTALGLTLDKANNKIYKTADATKTAISAYQGFFGQTYTYKAGDYAPENYLKEKYPTKYSALTNKVVGNTVDGSAFMYMYTDASVVDQSSKLYEVLFKGTTAGENRAKSYWLASSGVDVYGSDDCYFGPGAVFGGGAEAGYVLFNSDGYSRAGWLAVRPVVYLKSTVTIEDLTFTSTGSEADWTTQIPSSYTGEPLDKGQIMGETGLE